MKSVNKKIWIKKNKIILNSRKNFKEKKSKFLILYGPKVI